MSSLKSFAIAIVATAAFATAPAFANPSSHSADIGHAQANGGHAQANGGHAQANGGHAVLGGHAQANGGHVALGAGSNKNVNGGVHGVSH
jgi:hypothetical protein